jgi:hypothetical protein
MHFSCGRAVQIYDMQAGRSHGLPFKGNIERVIGKNSFPVIVALIQADALAAFYVYRRYNIYFRPLSIK